MASVSSATTSLGNTTLRGYGGLASGIDRDSIIEQMSLASTTKIQEQKNAITSLTWKQEAYRSIIDQILDLQDNYFSYSGASSMMDSSLFAKSVITANGDESVTKYLTASGASEMLDYISVRGVESLATAANVQSATLGSGAIETDMSFDKQPQTSELAGKQLIFGNDAATGGAFNNTATFTFYTSYKDENGDTQYIDYTTDNIQELADDLNAAIKANRFVIEKDSSTSNSGVTLEFRVETDEAGNEKLAVGYAKVSGLLINDEWSTTSLRDEDKSYIIRSNSSALSALGFTGKDSNGDAVNKDDGYGYGYNLSTINNNATAESFQDSYIKTYDNMAQYLQGQKFSITYGGTSKSVELITSADYKALAAEKEELQAAGKSEDEIKDAMNASFAAKMQNRLDQAFGKNKITVGINEDTGKITFDDATGNGMVLTVTAGSSAIGKETGLDKLNSTKLSLSSSLENNMSRLGLTEDDFDEDGNLLNFTINGVTISGITKETTVNQLIDKVNSSGAGVRMNYLSTSNKFTLVSKETGSGRDIALEGSARTIFNGATGEGYSSSDGTEAVMYVDYGTGTPEKIVSSTNTFDLDGLKINVTGTFGVTLKAKLDADGNEVKDADGNVVMEREFDTSLGVTFDAKADVDNAVEKVKKFIEDFNALVKEVNTQITTKPDSDYGPLTDDQKAEMDETSIENWENKAKEGLLFNNASMRDLSMDIQGILTKFMGSGVSYDDLAEIGISPSEDIYDGGTLVFDESKFRTAMTNDPEKVSNIITGGGNVTKGLSSVMNDTLKTYATRYAYLNGGSYGRLVEEAGSEKISLSMQNNTIYNQLKDMQTVLEELQTRLKTEQDQYIQQFTYMEQAINNMNTQASYLSSITG